MRKNKDEQLGGVARFFFTEARKTEMCSTINEANGWGKEWYTLGIFLTSICAQDGQSKAPESRVQISGDEGVKLAGVCIPATTAPHAQLQLPSLPALCDECLCPLGATISPSNSFQPGIHTASPIPFSGSPKPALLQRDRQLVRLGEVAFDVPGSAEASLFAHIKAEEI